MKIKKLLPYKTNKDNFRNIIKKIAKGDLFCLESFSSYLERHEKKNKIDRKKTLKVFVDYPVLSCYEFVREVVRNYLIETGSVFINNYKTLSLKNKEIKEEVYNYYKSNRYYPSYFNSITGRIYSNYQSWSKVNNKHMLNYLSKETLISVDVKSCVLSVYLNFLSKLGEDLTLAKKIVYESEKDPYIFFFIKIFISSLIEDDFYNEKKVYRYFLDRKPIFQELIKISKIENKPINKEYVLSVIKSIGKKLLIAYIYQGESFTFKDMSKLFGIKKKILDYRIVNSPFKIGKWNRFIYNITKCIKKEGVVLERVFKFYIPPLNDYFKRETRIPAYILENLSNYSIFSSMIKLMLKDIPIRAYYFDEVLIPKGYLEYKKDIKECFLNNNLMPLNIRIKT